MSNEALTALHEFREPSRLGWRQAHASGGLLTEWSSSADGSLWLRISGELAGAELAHVVAVAYEVELWPRWAPFCSAGATLQSLGPMERICWSLVRDFPSFEPHDASPRHPNSLPHASPRHSNSSTPLRLPPLKLSTLPQLPCSRSTTPQLPSSCLTTPPQLLPSRLTKPL